MTDAWAAVVTPSGPAPELAADDAALRHGVGAMALPRDVLEVRGRDAVAYLQGQCSQDVAALAEGASADALLLSPQGRLDALVRVTRVAEDGFVVDVDGGFGDAVLSRLLRFRLRVAVEVTLLPWRGVALRGPQAPELLPELAGASGVALALPWSWHGLEGVDLLGEAPAVPAGVRWCTTPAWEALRVEAGVPVMGAELDERTIAAEAGLVARTVSFTKGCYTGQELVARLDARGSNVARRLRGVVVTGPLPAGHVVPPVGTPLQVGGKAVGMLTSVAWSPALGLPVALAYLHRSVEPPCPVELHVPDGSPSGAVAVPAEARPLPLVAH